MPSHHTPEHPNISDSSLLAHTPAPVTTKQPPLPKNFLRHATPTTSPPPSPGVLHLASRRAFRRLITSQHHPIPFLLPPALRTLPTATSRPTTSPPAAPLEEPIHFRLKNNIKENVDFVENEDQSERKNLAIFVSGGGSNFKAIYEAAKCGLINGKVVALVTDKPGCGGAEYAKRNGIPVISFPKTELLPEGMSVSDLVTTLRNHKVDFIILAGYLKLIPVELVRAYPQRMLNIHPSLLPAFGGKGYYGTKVHKAVIASGARYSGPTVHFVDENFDTGKILAQRVVPVLPNDTMEQLAARVLVEEHKVYVEAVSALCEERVVWREDGVPIIRNRDNPNEYL